MKNILKRTLTIVIAVAILTGFVPWGAMNFATMANASEIKANSIEDEIVFSLNIVSETDTEVVVSVNLDKGAFKALDLEVKTVNTKKIGKCFYNECSNYLKTLMEEIKDDQTEVLGAFGYVRTQKFGMASTFAYDREGTQIAILKFEKNIEAKVTNEDLSLVIIACHDRNSNYTTTKTVNNLPDKASVLQESGIEKVVISDVVVMQEIDVQWYHYESGKVVYKDEPKLITIYYGDGKTELGDLNTYSSKLGYYFRALISDKTENEIDEYYCGTYQVNLKFAGIPCCYNVEVLEKSDEDNKIIDHIDIDDIELTQGVYIKQIKENGKVTYYDNPEDIIICYKDGTKESVWFEEIIDPDWSSEWKDSLSYKSEYEFDPDYVGTYKVNIIFAGIECSYNVKIKENEYINKIEKVVIDDIVRTQREDVLWIDENGKAVYNTSPEQITVYYKDGSTESGDIYTYSDVLNVDFWELLETNDGENFDLDYYGTCKFNALFAGIPCSYNLKILENNIKSISIGDVCIREGIDGYYRTDYIWNEELEEDQEVEYFYYEINPEKITITYKDGTSISGTPSYIYKKTGYEFYQKFKQYVETDQSYENQWGIGKHSATFEILGERCNFNVIVEPANETEQYKEVKISGTDKLKLTFTKINGQKETFDIVFGACTVDGHTSCDCILETSTGKMLNAVVFSDSNYKNQYIEIYGLNKLTSNVISSNIPIYDIIYKFFYVSNGCVINYDPNGGSVSPESETSNENIILPTPIRDGYTCLGWSEDSKATDATYLCGAEYKPQSDITLYAVWKANSYTIKFYDGSTLLGSKSLKFDESGTLSYGKVPVKEGYHFVGWSTIKGGPALFSNGQSIKGLAANDGAIVSYYAVWEKDENEVITDKDTGIVLDAPADAFEGNPTLKIDTVLSGSAFDIVSNQVGGLKCSVFSIETYVDGVKTQPNGYVTVKIPVPDGFDAKKCKLYYVNTNKNVAEEIKIQIVNNFIVFQTNHFSDWAVVETKGKVNSVSLNSFELNYKSSAYINPTIEADSGVKYKVEYKSSNTSIATVDNNGNVYAAKKGNATITCTVTDEYGNQVSDTCNVTVGYTWWQWIIKIVLFGWIWY